MNLVHSSIAWSDSATSSNATTIHYNVSIKGHSGAALLLHGQQVIGLHSEGFNDLPQEYSGRSPSIAADAARLDHPTVRAAIGVCRRILINTF